MFEIAYWTDPLLDNEAIGSSEPVTTQIDFQFLNFTHPSDAKASRARRTVRSHVTRRQHAQETKLQAARKAQSYHGNPIEPEQPPPMLRQHAATLPSQTPPALDLSSNTRKTTVRTSSPEGSSASSPSPTTSTGFSPEQRIDLSEVYDKAWHPYISHIMVSVFLSQPQRYDIADLRRTTICRILLSMSLTSTVRPCRAYSGRDSCRL